MNKRKLCKSFLWSGDRSEGPVGLGESRLPGAAPVNALIHRVRAFP